MTHYALLVGAGNTVFPATAFVELTSGASTFTVPQGANAIHIQYAISGGGGAICGADYDGAGGESQGPGGGSGGYISDKIITVTAGETITYAVGAAGTEGDATRDPLTGNRYVTTAGNGGNTTLTGDSTGSLINLTGGGGSSATGGNVRSLRTNSTGVAGTATINGTAITSGDFIESDYSIAAVDTNTSGPTGTFNDSDDGNAGDITGNGNCGFDNCRIDGGDGGSSYGTAVAGGAGGSSSGSGTNGTAGTRGSGGGGGAAQTSGAPFTDGSAGGAGELKYRFINVT